MRLLKNTGEVDMLLAAGNPVMFYKHSTQCDACEHARKEVSSFEPDAVSTLIVQVNVIEDREVSNYIADKLGVQHESPQVILFKDGRVLWDADHFDISVESLKEANKLAYGSVN